MRNIWVNLTTKQKRLAIIASICTSIGIIFTYTIKPTYNWGKEKLTDFITCVVEKHDEQNKRDIDSLFNLADDFIYDSQNKNNTFAVGLRVDRETGELKYRHIDGVIYNVFPYEEPAIDWWTEEPIGIDYYWIEVDGIRHYCFTIYD